MTSEPSAETGFSWPSATSGRRDWLGISGLLLLLMLIAAAITAILSDYQVVSWITWLLLVVVSSLFAASYLALRRLAEGWLKDRDLPWWGALVIRALALVASVGLAGEVVARVLELLGGEPASRSRGDLLAVGLMITTAMALVEQGYRWLRIRIREHELREERLRRQALRSELAALKARIDPHFLFNSLNVVAGLVEEDPVAGAEALQRLASLYRFSLEASRLERVSLRKELDAVESYLEIETLRMGDRLAWEIDADESISDHQVPPLVLQPLVENAIRHGIAPCREGGRVRVRVREDDRGRLLLEVEDDGVGSGHLSQRGSGTGLADLEERLAIVSGGDAVLERSEGSMGGHRVRVHWPGFGKTDEGRR